MPIRDSFPKEYFDGNPYEGETPEEAYKRLRWGNEPNEVFEIDAPEPMATIGTVAKLIAQGGSVSYTEAEAPYLAVGLETNRVYIVPRRPDGGPVDIPSGPYTDLGLIQQIDYYSDKGGEEAYYYHEHEAPFPSLCIHEGSGVALIEPDEMEDGSRSYAVGDEGIIG
jgi:hypothetical protein